MARDPSKQSWCFFVKPAEWECSEGRTRIIEPWNASELKAAKHQPCGVCSAPNKTFGSAQCFDGKTKRPSWSPTASLESWYHQLATHLDNQRLKQLEPYLEPNLDCQDPYLAQQQLPNSVPIRNSKTSHDMPSFSSRCRVTRLCDGLGGSALGKKGSNRNR